MTTKVKGEDYFGDYQNDGNDLSLKERIDEIAKVGFPIEFTDWNTIVNNDSELSELVNERFNAGKE